MDPLPNSKPPLRLFLEELLRRPRQMGTLWPSSPALAQAMARWLPGAREQWILELGPGTGIVTKSLLAAGLPEDRLLAIEKSESLAGFLGQRFPRARIIAGDAMDLNHLIGGEKVGAVFSSLPLKAFPPDQVRRISAEIWAALIPGGVWVQYSYHLVNGGLPPGAFAAEGSNIVWRNFPPAKVSAYRSLAGAADS